MVMLKRERKKSVSDPGCLFQQQWCFSAMRACALALVYFRVVMGTTDFLHTGHPENLALLGWALVASWKCLD